MEFNQSIKIGKFLIDHQSPTFIIAEAGVNHGGDIESAKKLVDLALEAGADAVKFQAFRTEKLIINNIDKAPYQKERTSGKETQAEMLKKLELNVDAYVQLLNYCNTKGILFLITPFDEESLTELEAIGVQAYKIASTDATNLLFLRKIAKTGKPIILSTGMCDLHEVECALQEISAYNKNVILLQCTANYPIMDSEANLNVIKTFQDKFNILVGYSDHSVGIGAAPYAIPMGAKILEKHFTLDKSLDGPDHLASLDPAELKLFVKQVRKVEEFLGSNVKGPTKSELQTKKSLQKCFVAAEKIQAGDKFTEGNIVAKRTGGRGISPLHYKLLLGKASSKNYLADDIIEEEVQ